MGTSSGATAAQLYRAVWRWHFYAGLLVLPFLVSLAVTGGLYLYKPEIERAVYARWMHVEPQGARLPLGTLAQRVEQQTGGGVSQIISAAAPGESWRMTLVTPAGKRTAFVDPHDGRVLGTTGHGGVMGTVKDVHSLMIAGPIGNAVIEIVAGWTVVLVLTGAYLWWPRGVSPAIGMRGRPSRRLFWRDLHASTGLVAGAVVLFLAVTGMPWSGVAGDALEAYVASHGLGRPEAPKARTVAAHHGHDAAGTLPWSLQHAALPQGSAGADIGPDRALAAAAAHGIAAPWTLTLPARPGTPYVASAAIVRAEDAHAVYVDAASGRVLQDAQYDGFGPAARTIEWGIAVHQGLEYGEANRLLMLFGCVCVVLLAVSAATMWWKRRLPGTLSAPPPMRRVGGLVAIMLVLGVVLPLTGLTMLAALALDVAMQRYDGAAAAS